jgi:hypothetical protein
METFAYMALGEMTRARDSLAKAFGDGEFGPEELVGMMCGVGVIGIITMTVLTLRHIKIKRQLKEYFAQQRQVGEGVRNQGIENTQKELNKLFEEWKASRDYVDADVTGGGGPELPSGHDRLGP